MTRREAAMIIEAIPDKIWNQMQESEREAILMGVRALEAKTVSVNNIVKKLDDRISEFIKKQPDKKSSEAVVMMQELIHIIELEVENGR